MNVLFVYSLHDVQSIKQPLRSHDQMQFGISYISALLKHNGHRTELLVLSRVFKNKNKKILDDYIRSYRPELVCFTAVSTEYPFIENIAKYIKLNYPGIYLLIGGPHVSIKPACIPLGLFDALCVGEGEYATLNLASQLEKRIKPSCIPNLWLMQDSKVEKNIPNPFLQDLDSLPFPDRDMWEGWIDEEVGARPSVLLGRGCPFQCTYCCNHALRKIAPGNYVRLRKAEKIIEEIIDISKRYPQMREVFFEVETFASNINWALDFCQKLESFNLTLHRPLFYGTNVRIFPGADIERLFAAFIRSNIVSVNIGIESGSETLRTQTLKRVYSNEDIVDAVKIAKKYGLRVGLLNMVGLPGESLSDFSETVNINRICQPDWLSTSIFFPYPGTDLYTYCKNRGFLKEPLDIEMERAKAVLDFPEFPRKQIQKKHIWFEYWVYKGNRPKYKLLARVFLRKIKSKDRLNYFYRKLSHLRILKKIRHFFRADIIKG